MILVRTETSPEDIHGMHAARGILTARGGMTSHAAVVARGMGRPCVSGAGMLKIDAARGEMVAGNVTIKRGDIITIDGTTGQVFKGTVRLAPAGTDRRFRRSLMGWADEVRRLKVRTNADTPDDAATARRFGAEGIGLCRTEHMFFEADRILAVRQMILADARRRAQSGARQAAADAAQRFRGDLQGDGGLARHHPPARSAAARIPAAEGGGDRGSRRAPPAPTPAKLRARAIALHESNPMLGHRGCRLGITYPEIYEMQARAILEAALAVEEAGGSPGRSWKS